jgi:O-antigen/teichoic acid export membrane protein
VRLRFRARLFRIGAGYATRAFLATLFGFVLMRVGVVVLQLQANMAEVGQYSIAQQIGDALILLPSTVGLLLFPSLLRLPKGNDRWRAAMSAIVRLGSAMLVVVAIVAVATPLGVRLVFGPAYIAAAPLILGLLPTVLLTSIIIVFSQYLSASGFPWSQVAIWAAALLLHIALTLVLVGSLGAMGVVISLDCVNAFVLVALGVLAWRQREPRTTTEEAKPA